MWGTISSGAMAAAGQITDALDLDDKLANFNDKFAGWLSDAVSSQLELIKKATSIFDWLGSLFTDSGDAFDDAKIERLEKKSKAGKATEEEKAEIASLKKERAADKAADEMYISRSGAERMGLQEKKDDDVALKAWLYGVSDEELRDPKKREELANRRVTDEDLANFSEGDADDFMLAMELKKRQDAKDAQDKAGYFGGSAWGREAQSGGSSTTINNGQTSSTTVNQQIVIQGSADPTSTGRAVAAETQKAASRYSKRGLV